MFGTFRRTREAQDGVTRDDLLSFFIFIAVVAGLGCCGVQLLGQSAVIGLRPDLDLWKDRALARLYASLPISGASASGSIDTSASKLRTFVFPTVRVARAASSQEPALEKRRAARYSPPDNAPVNIAALDQTSVATAHSVRPDGPPRSLDDALKWQILDQLSKSKPIRVQALMGDAESLHFATEIAGFLIANGFDVIEHYPSQVAFNAPLTGLHVEDQGDHQVFIVAASSPS